MARRRTGGALARRPGRYRWVVLATGVVAQACSAAVLQGLPALAPRLREELGLGLTGLGVLLASVTAGLVATLVLWGAAADRFGERRVMTTGLLLASAALGGTLAVEGAVPLGATLVLAGAACASVNAASGRAVLGWFPTSERGLAMGVRQTALPLGAGVAAAVLPPVAAAGGLDAAFGLLLLGTLGSAALVATLVREGPLQVPRDRTVPPRRADSPVRDPVVRRLGLVSLLLVVPQFAVVAFLVVYLVDEQDVSPARAALALAAVQLAGAASRIGVGRWSDAIGRRVLPLRRLAVAVTALFVAVTVLHGSAAVVVVLLVAGAVAISPNGLVFLAVGERAAPGRTGIALGLQNTAVAVGAMLTPPVLGAVVDAAGWRPAYALAATAGLAAVLLLRRLVQQEQTGARAGAGRAPAPGA